MKAAASDETVYEIRSITKQFTAALILRLVEAGKLSLDDPLTKYLPDYPMQGRTVTLRQLLNHTSGLTAVSSSLDLETALHGGNRQWF
jgi:CubicO group peptidase (beta-lactamase class C family)